MPRRIVAELERATKTALPQEACGFLYGVATADWVRIQHFEPIRNLSRNPFQVRMDPVARQQHRASNGALAYFHSHVYSTTLSGIDKMRIRESPQLWIVGSFRFEYRTGRSGRFALAAYVSSEVVTEIGVQYE